MTTPAARRALDRAAAGERLSPVEAVIAHEESSFHDLAAAAHAVREARTDPAVATYVVDRNINYTNVCDVYCAFCAFYRTPKDKDAYTLTIDDVLAKIEPLVAIGGTQVLIQGGLNEAVPLAWIEDLFRAIRRRYPSVDVHALTATEIDFYAKREGIDAASVLRRLRDAGLRSLPGGGMEILVDDVRRRVSPRKTSAADYVAIHRECHRQGMTTTATMMFGVGETVADRVEHLRKIRELQDEAVAGGRRGFTAFIPWTFQTDGSTQLKLPPPTAHEYLKMIALSRLFLDNQAHVQAGWVTEGPKIAQLALWCGADDWGGILMEENVISAAGTLFGMNPAAARRYVRDAGFVPAQRDTYYRVLRRFDEATPDECPVPADERLVVHLGHVGNRGRDARAPNVNVGRVGAMSKNPD